jgi:predicted aldo/keto reductase-like oxidoreductase
MKRFLETRRNSMEFCQIQLNYLDWVFQSAKDKVDMLNDFNIPIWVMEPLRGGQLAVLSEDDTARLNTLRADEKIPAWAFRFIQSIPGIIVSLTGVSNLEQLKENIKTHQTEKPLEKNEFETLLGIAEGMVRKTNVPCTDCKYCMSHCPQGLDIPSLLNLYNEHCFTISKGGMAFIAPMALALQPDDKMPKACVACRKCEGVCPQQINISEAMDDFTKELS